MNFWKKILEEKRQNKNLVFMCVIDSNGSSPGRKGFKMYVTNDHKLEGSIGGGIMEHKLIEVAKSLLEKGSFRPFLKRQIHRPDLKEEKSGLICSGEQTIAFYYLSHSDSEFLEELSNDDNLDIQYIVVLDQNGCSVNKSASPNSATTLNITKKEIWSYSEPLNHKERVNIIGGGHVGLALSQVMNLLGFHIAIYDERNELNTMKMNSYSHENHVVEFEKIADIIPDNPQDYVVIMTFGYRSDEICIKQLLNRTFKYFGVMGSTTKMDTLLNSLFDQGFSKKMIDKIYSPIGVQINSQTPMEIAISVAAEIISVKNKSNK